MKNKKNQIKILIGNNNCKYILKLPQNSYHSEILYQFVKILELYCGYMIVEDTILDVLEKIKNEKQK